VNAKKTQICNHHHRKKGIIIMSAIASSSTSPQSGTSRKSVGNSNRKSMIGGKHSSSVSLSASQFGHSSSGQNSTGFTFKPHVLLSGIDEEMGRGKRAILDYSQLNDRIEIFKELMNAHLDQVTGEMESKRDQHQSTMRDQQSHVNAIKEGIEKQKDEQKTLYQTVAAERQAESSAQSQLALLQASRTSLGQRLTEAEAERDTLQASLEKKKRSFEQRKQRLNQQVRRNRPELMRFNEKLGCRVSAGHQPDPSNSTFTDASKSSNRSIIKFTFNLIDPDDWSYEANFVIDASRSQYKIVSAKPALPSEDLQRMLADLNKSRALFTFIKSMRSAFKQQIEKQKHAKKSIQP
jgi:kinetochore protein Spc25, fungi type